MSAETMKAAVVLKAGETDIALEMREDSVKPTRKAKELLVRVHACSTAAADVHMLSGKLSLVLAPPEYPYIPGKDVSGVVEEADEGSVFKKGDEVVASRDFQAYGGMAEFVVVPERRATLKAAGIPWVKACACTDSAITARIAVDSGKVKGGDRVLVLGGSGGVGSFAVQMVNLHSPSLLAVTSTQSDMVTRLGADLVIDYRTEDWWERADFKQDKLDVIIDCVGGNDHFTKACRVLKSKWSGGCFVAVVGDDPKPVVRTVPQLLGFAAKMMWRPVSALFNVTGPSYAMVMSGVTTEYLDKVLPLLRDGKIDVALDPASPLPFTAEGVKSALAIQASGHAHGKVVVQVVKESGTRVE